MYQAANGSGSSEVALAANNLAEVFVAMGKYNEAEAGFRASISLTVKALGEGHPNEALARTNLANLLLLMGNFPAAEAVVTPAIATYERLNGPKHPSLEKPLRVLAKVHALKHEDAAAEALLIRVRDIESAVSTTSPGYASILSALAGHYDAVDQPAQVSRAAHVYLFQKSPNGTLNVLFPDARITVKNPVPAAQDLRIPQGGASFKLDAADIGTERVFVVASLEPIQSLAQAVSGLSGGAPAGAPVLAVTRISKLPECKKTRALSFEDDAPAPGCTRERGLSFDEDATPAQPSSITARTEAGDSVIARAFSFEHLP